LLESWLKKKSRATTIFPANFLAIFFFSETPIFLFVFLEKYRSDPTDKVLRAVHKKVVDQQLGSALKLLGAAKDLP